MLLGQAQANQRLLRAVEAALGIEHAQIAVHTGLKTRFGQLQRFLRGVYGAGLCAQARTPLCAVGQGVGHFAKGRLHGFFVLRQGDALVGLRYLHPGAQAPAVKNGQLDLRHKAPGAIAAGKQRIQFPAGRADAAGQGNAGKQRRTGGPDVGLHGAQLVFGGLHIRALQQHTGGQGRRPGEQSQVVGRVVHQRVGAGQQVWGQAAAQQQLQGVAAARHLRGVGRHVATRALHAGQVLRQCQPGDGPQLEHAPVQRIGFFSRGQGLLRQLQACHVSGHVEPSVAHLGQQPDLHVALVGLRLQKALEARRAQIAHPAPQIQLVAGKAQLRAVLLANAGLAGVAQVGAGAAACALRLRMDAGQQIGTGDAVLGAGFFDVGQRHTQVAVVF